VRRADAVCRAYATRIAPKVQPRSYGQIVAYVDRTLPLYAAALQKLEQLRPPASDASAVHAWLAADRDVERSVRKLGVAAQRRDFPSVTAAATAIELAGSRGRRAALGLGLQVCGQLVSGR
jgi:hypothetical protein